MTRTKPAREYLIEVAEQNGWVPDISGCLFTRADGKVRIDVTYDVTHGVIGGVSYCSRNSEKYEGPDGCGRVAEWLMEPLPDPKSTTVTLPSKGMRVHWRGQDGTVTEVRIEVVIHLDGKLPGHLTIATPDEIEFGSPR